MSKGLASVSDGVFASRHRFLVIWAWVNVPLLAAIGLAAGASIEAVGLLSMLLIAMVATAMLARDRLVASCAVTLALVAAAIGFVTFTDAAAHLPLLVTVAVVALYRDWRPIALAVTAIAGYHLVVGLAPDGPGLIWVGTHSGFILLLALVSAVGWRAAPSAVDIDSIDRLRLAFEEAPIGMAMLKPSGEFIQVNRAMSRLLGYEQEHFPRTTVRGMVHGDDLVELGDAWERMGNDEGHSATVWARCLTSSGSSIWGRLSLSMTSWAPQRPAMVVLQLEDISAAHAEQRRLERLLEGKDEFVAAVGSEIRRPLAVLVDLAGEDDPTLRRIGGQAREIASIVDDLVASAQVGAGLARVASLPIDTATLCVDVVGSVPDASDVVIDIQAPTMWADPATTRQILFGLVSNAVRYGGANVRVVAIPSGPDTVVAVADDGPAIPESERQRMFASDLRHGEPVTRPAAVGLGLTVGRQLARLMDGDVTYRRSPGENVFELRLPSERLDSVYGDAEEVEIPA